MNSFANGWQPPNNMHSLSLLYLHLTNPTGVLRTFSMTSSVEHTHTRTQSQSVLFILSIDLQLVQEPPKQLANKHRTGQTPSICIPHVFAANWAEARACACACGTITLNTHGVITKCQLGAGHSRQTKTEPVMCVIECVWCGFGSAKSSSRGWPPQLLLLLLLGHARTHALTARFAALDGAPTAVTLTTNAILCWLHVVCGLSERACVRVCTSVHSDFGITNHRQRVHGQMCKAFAPNRRFA